MSAYVGKISGNLFASDEDMIEYTPEQKEAQKLIMIQQHANELFEALKIVVAYQPLLWYIDQPKGYKEAIAVLDKIKGVNCG